jgi:streptogramin lyase
MIWVANSGEGTISKLDTGSGMELARYTVCGNPSRTSVDSQGNCWVGCRSDGKVAKILLDPDSCVDKNGNGKVDTSVDTNGNGTIEAGEMLPEGQDECVQFVVQPDGSTVARAVAVDKEDHAWVGFWKSRRIRRLNPNTGASEAEVVVPSSAGRPYGMAIDAKGRIWISLRDPGWLGMVDPSKEPLKVNLWSVPGNTYGIAVDINNVVWLAGGESQQIHWLDPEVGKINTISLCCHGNTRGVATTLDGFVFVAHHTWTCGSTSTARKISKIDYNTKKVIEQFDLGGKKGPVGVAIDFDGMLWTVNQCSSTTQKIDPANGNILGEFPTGKNPYTYSDMTGFQLKTVTAPQGTFNHIFEGWDGLQTQWIQINLDVTTPEGTSVQVRVRSAEKKEDLPDAFWSPQFGPYPPNELPVNLTAWAPVLGHYLEVQVKLLSNDSKSTPILKGVEAIAKSIAP